MLGTTLAEGRTLGPSSGSYLQRCCETNNINYNNNNRSYNNSNLLWHPLSTQLPPPIQAIQPEPAHLSSTFKIRTNTEVTESLFAAGGYNTPPPSSPFLPVSPFDLVAKSFHQSGSVAFSQANSIFVQSQTDYLNGTTSAVSKKTETCFGRWQHSTLEPLHIQVPPLQPVTNLTIKTESISCGRSNKFDLTPHHNQPNYNHHHQLSSLNNSNGDGSNSCGGGLVTTMTTSSPSTTCMPSSNDIINGCSRTIPISWSATPSSTGLAGAASSTSSFSNSSIPSSTSNLLSNSDCQQHNHQQNHAASVSSSSSSLTLLQIKREPCQVSEVTTSNNLGHHHQQQYHNNHHNQQQQNQRTATSLAVVKIESSSPKSTVMDTHPLNVSQSSAGAIPVGIAVARQRLQEHSTVSHQPKDVNRFGIGLADMGGATSSLSQNMFFTGTNSTMIPFSSDAALMGVSNAVQNAVRTPPTLWQYPTPVPVESMLPMPMPPVGFQLVRDPSTGQFLFLPTTAAIEPFQQTVVWPTYPQTTTSLQPPHLLLPPIAQPLQPPPLAPLGPLHILGSDYLTASTTLHQHTQTHSTRFVALTSDSKRKPVSGPTIPLPIPHHAVIKIEDCSSGSTTTTGTTTAHHHHHHHQSAIYGDDKANTSLHASAVQTNDMPTQLFYHPPSAGLIQIAPPSPSPLSSHHSQINSIQECRAIINHSPPPLIIPSLPPPSSILHPMSSPQVTTCLESPEQTVPENLEAASSCVPEVQDATIQTDTPVMSEDDNTVGAEECSLPSQTDDGRDAIPSIPSSSTSILNVCHNVSSNSIEEEEEEEEEKAEAESQEFLLQKQAETDSSRNDSGFDSNAVTSTNSLEEQSTNITEEPSWNCGNLSMRLNEEEPINNEIAETSVIEKEEDFKKISKITSTPVDLSGLELLSNISIEAFEKKIVFIKQEPIEEMKRVCYEPEPLERCDQEAPEENDEKSILLSSDKFVDSHEQLGGLNLLCALAEQRIQEEVGKRHRKRSSSSSDSHGSKKKKHKHSNGKKSSKKSRHDKDKKDRKRHRHSEELEEEIEDHPDEEQNGENRNDVLGTDIKETFNRVKAKFGKCENCDGDGNQHCCREKCNWPTPEELISAMETDMRIRLADITRQCQERKRELDEMSPVLSERKNQLVSDQESTPLSSKTGIFRSFQIDKQQSPLETPLKFICASPILTVENNPIVESQKISSDTESSKFEDIDTSSSSSSKRKAGNPRKNDDGNTETIVAKKPKSLVGYILASKNRSNENVKDKNVFDGAGFLTDDTTVFSESSCKLKASSLKVEPTVKQEIFEDENSKPVTDTFGLFSDSSNFSPEKKYHRKSSKHHSKHKKSKNGKERKHRSSELKERKRKIDARCLLTIDHLDKEKTRVLTAMGGLFYAGCLSALQPPDVYAVTLDGERGNRPHIMSREEVLRDAILEVSPSSVDEILPGTRLCAYWSQQYRCLYPGTVAEPGSPDSINDRKFVSVEFDDGDSGKIALEDIRFLLSDYPIVEYDPNPLLSLGKRKRRISQTHPESAYSKLEPTVSTSLNTFSLNTKIKTEIDKENGKERKRLKKIRKDRLKRLKIEGFDDASIAERKHKRKHKCGDELCKHRKHKKRRKHKKHHHREAAPILDSSQDADYSQDASQAEDEFAIEQEDSISQTGEMNNEEDAIGTATKEESTFDPNAKEDTMTEEDASSITESSGSVYEPGKKKERQNSADNHSKIAAFLPARQLWGWSGKGYRRAGAKGRAKKQFYKNIQRGKELITIGDSAVFLSTGRPDRPYIGRIESMWETTSSNKVVRVKWFYHPEETIGCPNLKFPGALFESPHEDENDVQTISHKCEVLPLDTYTNKFGEDPKQYQLIYDNNDTYYLAGHYDPTAQVLKLQENIPVLAENDKWV